jgi:FkbM family methyltransferase
VRYVGFEPNVKAAAYVDEIIHANELKNAMVVPVGLAAERRLASLFLASAQSTDPAASINEKFRDASFYGARKVIPLFDGDSALDALGIKDRNFIMKIDVEGAELDVIRGMQRTLREQRPCVVMEILPPAGFSDQVNQYRLVQAEEIKATMAGSGYCVARLGAAGELGRGIGTNDYLFVPEERAAELGL